MIPLIRYHFKVDTSKLTIEEFAKLYCEIEVLSHYNLLNVKI